MAMSEAIDAKIHPSQRDPCIASPREPHRLIPHTTLAPLAQMMQVPGDGPRGRPSPLPP